MFIVPSVIFGAFGELVGYLLLVERELLIAVFGGLYHDLGSTLPCAVALRLGLVRSVHRGQGPERLLSRVVFGPDALFILYSLIISQAGNNAKHLFRAVEWGSAGENRVFSRLREWIPSK